MNAYSPKEVGYSRLGEIRSRRCTASLAESRQGRQTKRGRENKQSGDTSTSLSTDSNPGLYNPSAEKKPNLVTALKVDGIAPYFFLPLVA